MNYKTRWVWTTSFAKALLPTDLKHSDGYCFLLCFCGCTHKKCFSVDALWLNILVCLQVYSLTCYLSSMIHTLYMVCPSPIALWNVPSFRLADRLTLTVDYIHIHIHGACVYNKISPCLQDIYTLSPSEVPLTSFFVLQMRSETPIFQLNNDFTST